MDIAAFVLTLVAIVLLYMDMTRTTFTIYPALICILVVLLLLTAPAVLPGLR